MSIKLGQNLISLGAQRLLSERAREVSSIFERLSTGLRINSAADDPAGLHLAAGLESESRVYTQALRNVTDAQSLVSIMEDALSEMRSLAERQKELAEQAANGLLSARQRSVLHTEATALSKEMNRILRSVEFNGMQVFDENNGSLMVHAGQSSDNFATFNLGAELKQLVGDGTYQAQVSFDVGLDPNSVIVADFNNDGHMDIATANYTDDSISILLGNGDGSFQPEIVNPSGDGPNSLRVGDFNNDGILDLAHNNYGDSGLGDTVSILIGAGDGTFTEVATVQTGLGPTSLDVGDINNDGNLDITAGLSAINFVSGLPEITRLTTQDNGRYEVTDVTLEDAPEQEVTTVTAIAGDTSIAEESTVTASNVGVREVTDVTMTNGDNSVAEVTDVTASGVGISEVTDFTMIEADNSVAEVTDVTMSEIGVREVTDLTMIEGDNSVAEVTDVTMSEVGVREVTDLTMESGANITSGAYFTIDSADSGFYVWYNVDGAGSDPAVGGRTGIEVAIDSTDTADQVAAKTATALDAQAGFSAGASLDTVTVTNAALGAVTDAADGTIGGAFGVSVTTQGTDSDIQENSYFTLESDGTSYYVWFNVGGTGADPTPGGTGIEVAVNYGDTASTVAAAVQAAIDAQGDFGASVLTDTVTVTNATGGAAADATTGDIAGATFSVTTTTQGVDSDMQSGDYFTIDSADTAYYVWYNVDGAGGDPVIGGRTGIEVAINSTDTADQVATKTATALDSQAGFNATATLDTVTVTNAALGAVTDAADGTIGGGFGATVTTQGTDSDIQENSYFTLESNGTSYYVWFNIGGTGADPTPGGTGIEVAVTYGDTAGTVAAAVQAALDAEGDFGASVLTDTVTVTNATGGAATDATTGDIAGATFSVTTTTQGVDSDMQSGDYFLLETRDTQYYVWYNIDGAGGDPAVGGRTGIEVALTAADDADTVATKTAAAIGAVGDFGASATTDTVTVTNNLIGAVTDATDGTIGGGFGATVTTQGTDSDIQEGSYFTLDTPDGDYYVWFDIDNASTDPAVAGRTGIEVDVSAGDDANTVAAAIQAAVDALGDFSASVVGDVVTVTNTTTGAVANATLGDISGGTFGVTTTTEGTDSDLQSGDYFTLSSGGTDYYVWYNVDAAGGDPTVAGHTGIEVAVLGTDTEAEIATKTATVLDAHAAFTASAASDVVTITNATIGSVTDIADGNIGGAFSATTTTQGTDSDIREGSYFTLDTPGTDYYIWFDIDNTSTDPAVAGRTGIEIDVSAGDDAATVAAAIQAAIDPLGDFTASVLGSDVTITNTATGPVADITKGDITGSTFAVTTDVQGAESDILTGDYFYLNSPDTDYYVWFNVDAAGGDPAIGGRTGIEVAINSADDADTVAAKIQAAIDAEADFNASVLGDEVTVTNRHGGVATDGSDQTVGGAFDVTTVTQGQDSVIGNGDYFTIDTAGDDYYVWFNFDGATDPALAGRTGVEINATYGDSAATLASLVDAALDAQPDFNGDATGSTVTITGTNLANDSIAEGSISGLGITTVIDGYAPVILSGQYFELDSSSDSYYVWYNVDGAGGDPAVGGRTGIEVAISDGDTAESIATATAAAIDARPELDATSTTNQVTVTDTINGPIQDAVNINVGGTFDVNTIQQGTATRVDIGLDEIFVPGHNLATGSAVTLSTAGTLPDGLSAGPTYYVIAVDANTIALATSQANALSDTRIDILDFGVGVHSIIPQNAGDSGGVSLGNGDGTFGSTVPFQAGTQPQDFKLADVNLDGRLDLLIAEAGDGTIAVQLGTPGGFQSYGSFAIGIDPVDIETADINGDGHIDIVAAIDGDDTVAVLFGDSTGNFTSAGSYSTEAGSPSKISLGDLNGDGHLDIVTTDYNGGTGTGGTVFLNNGDGTFTSAGTYTAGNGVIDSEIADFNGDGINDIVVVNEGDGTVGILFANTEETMDLPQVDLMSADSARASLTTISSTLDRISAELGNVGAAASRLQHMGSYILGQRDQIDAARARITEVDFAQEIANLIHKQILQQAATALIAQAGLDYAIVLDLLQE